MAVSCSEAAVAAAATGGARLESFPVVEVNTYRLWRAGQEVVCEALFPVVLRACACVKKDTSPGTPVHTHTCPRTCLKYRSGGESVGHLTPVPRGVCVREGLSTTHSCHVTELGVFTIP